MTPEMFVNRLKNVQKKGERKWLCSCPAHADSDPSLAVTATNNGKILLKCFAGCSAMDVVQSIGLKLEDLFPDAYEEPPMAFAQREMAAKAKKESKIDYAVNYLAIITARLRDGVVVHDHQITKATKLKQYLQEQGVA
jgi:hypothetical protein